MQHVSLIKRGAGFLVGLMVPLCSWAAWKYSRPPVPDIVQKIADAEGIPASVLQEIVEVDQELKHTHTTAQSRWNRLIELSKDSNPTIREEAFNVIPSAYKSPFESDALRQLDRLKNDPSEKVRSTYVFSLVRLRSSQWEDAQKEALKDSSPVVREVAQGILPIASEYLAKRQSR